MKILVALDGSSFSDEALESVAARPWPKNSEIKVISAVELPPVYVATPWSLPASYPEEFANAAKDRAMSTVEHAISKLRQKMNGTVKLSSATPVGSAKQIILNEAEEWNADLIVLGSHGYGAWTRLLLGSVSSAVATHAHCSVEIVRKSNGSAVAQ